MSVKAMEQVFNRWFLDSQFRAQMNEDPKQALVGYNLTGAEREKMSRLSRKIRRQAKAKKNAVRFTPLKSSVDSAIKYTRPTNTWADFNLN